MAKKTGTSKPKEVPAGASFKGGMAVPVKGK